MNAARRLPKPIARLAAWAALLAAFLVVSGPAAAHPHVFVDGKVRLATDAGGRLVAIDNIWTFDAPFSAYATQGLDTNGDGKLSADELKQLAATNMDALKDYHFFTYASTGGKQVTLGPPRDYFLTVAGPRLTLHFTLPLAEPVALDGSLSVEVFDPEYFVAFTFPGTAPATVTGAEAQRCHAVYQAPHELDGATAARLAAIPADEHDLPPALKDAAAGLAHLFRAVCS